MARKKKQEGQPLFDFCLDKGNCIVQANILTGGTQTLKPNSAKLIRNAIIQAVQDDGELKPYTITIPELAKLLNISQDDIYKDIEGITDDIVCTPVCIRKENGKKVSWIYMPWVVWCEYHSDRGIYLKLNKELKSLLVNLKDHFKQEALVDLQ